MQYKKYFLLLILNIVYSIIKDPYKLIKIKFVFMKFKKIMMFIYIAKQFQIYFSLILNI